MVLLFHIDPIVTSKSKEREPPVRFTNVTIINFPNSDNGFAIEIPWGNATGSLRWNHLFNDKLFMNTSIIFSDYRFEFNLAQSDFEFKMYFDFLIAAFWFDFDLAPNAAPSPLLKKMQIHIQREARENLGKLIF